MDENSELILEIQKILNQLKGRYEETQKIDEKLRARLYEKLKKLPNCEEITKEFERIFKSPIDERDSEKLEIPEEPRRKSPRFDNQAQQNPSKSSQKPSKRAQKTKNAVQSSTQNDDVVIKSEAKYSMTVPIRSQRSAVQSNEIERKQTCVELFADFGSFFNKSLSKVGFKYCTESEIVRRGDVMSEKKD